MSVRRGEYFCRVGEVSYKKWLKIETAAMERNSTFLVSMIFIFKRTKKKYL